MSVRRTESEKTRNRKRLLEKMGVRGTCQFELDSETLCCDPPFSPGFDRCSLHLSRCYCGAKAVRYCEKRGCNHPVCDEPTCEGLHRMKAHKFSIKWG